MEKLKQIKTQILKLHTEWEATTDDIGGFKDAECIESEVEDLIISYCEEKNYTINSLTIENLKAL
jgi:hypothetical protein